VVDEPLMMISKLFLVVVDVVVVAVDDVRLQPLQPTRLLRITEIVCCYCCCCCYYCCCGDGDDGDCSTTDGAKLIFAWSCTAINQWATLTAI
jgi:hypothetical protein